MNNGMSADELRETLLMTAPHRGIPAALDAFREAGDFLRRAT